MSVRRKNVSVSVFMLINPLITGGPINELMRGMAWIIVAVSCKVSADEQWRIRSDCVDEQDNLSLYGAHVFRVYMYRNVLSTFGSFVTYINPVANTQDNYM